MADESEAQLGKVPDTPDLFEPNPLLNKFLFPMGDTILSESCPAGTLSHIKARQEYWCGYLNVKTLQLGPEKKSKDRSWHCYWAQVSDDQLLLYKVETMSSHTNSSHPPTDKDCPPKHLMQEVDRISLVKAVVGLEYTYKAEAKNRRRYLFRITQENGADYLLQASSDGAAVCWSETLRTIAGRYSDHTVDEDFIREIAIKRMREGDKKVGKAGKGGAINTPILPKTASPAPPLDPAVLQLKNVLQKKIDLLYHLKQMEKVFSNQLQPRTPSPEVVPQFYFTDDDSHVGCCSSPSEASTGRNSSVFERREATMLKDYYLIAGAAWSLLNKGEKVIVLQELRSGYYLVKATRNAIIQPNKLETKRNISDSFLANQANPAASSGRYSEPTSPANVDATTSTVSILIQQSSDSNLVPSDSFQSTISDDSGIVESSKRASNLSNKEDEGTSETGGVPLENGNGEDGFETTFKAYSTASLPANIHISKSKLSTPPASGRITNSVSFGTISEHSGKDHVSLPLIGSVPPSVLDCYVEQLFSPTLVRPHSSNLVLQPPPPPSSKSPATKKKKSNTKGNRLSLQVDNYSLEDQSMSAKQKSSTLPPNSTIADSPVGQKAEKGKRGFKNFFKKRLSTHGKLLSSVSTEGDSDKEFLSVHEDSLPSDVDRVQSPVYEYTPITHSGQEFRRRGKSFVYTIGGSSSDSDSDDESEASSDKSGSSRSRRKRIEASTPPSDKRSSIASNESSTKEEAMFEISMDDSSPQQKPKGTGSDHDVKESPEHNAMEELVVPRKHTRTSLKKMKSLPTTIGKDDIAEAEEDDKRVHRLSAGEFPSIEISMRAPPLNKRRHVYLDAKVQKFGFRLETYGRISTSGEIADTVVYTVTQGSAAFLAGMYPGDVILEVEGVNVSEKNCNELGSIIASYKKTQQVICLTVKFIDGVRRLDLRKMEQKNQRKNSDRYSTASSEGDSSDSEDRRLSGPPFSPQATGPGLGRISETTEEEVIVEEEATELLPQAQVVSPSQA